MVWLCHNNFIFSKSFFTFFSLFCFYVSMKYFQFLLVAKWTEACIMWWIFCLPYPHSFQIHLCALLCPSLCSGWGGLYGQYPLNFFAFFPPVGFDQWEALEGVWKEWEERVWDIYLLISSMPCHDSGTYPRLSIIPLLTSSVSAGLQEYCSIFLILQAKFY